MAQSRAPAQPPRQVPDLRPPDRARATARSARAAAPTSISSRWLRGTYAIPDAADDDEDGELPEPPADDKGDPGRDPH